MDEQPIVEILSEEQLAQADLAAQAAAEQAAQEQAALALAQEQAAQEQAAQEQAAQEQAAQEQAAQEQAALEQAAQEQAALEQAAQEQAAQEQAAQEQAALEQAAQEQAALALAQEQAALALAQEQAAQEQAALALAQEQAAQEQAVALAKEQADINASAQELANQQIAQEQEAAQARAEQELVAQQQQSTIVPKLIFVVPFRNRAEQKEIFDNIMPKVLEDIPSTDYKIYFIQQCDTRDFNRGAMKNIGFLAMKEKYPNDYQNITFVFNDVDTMPRTKNLLNYNTEPGTIKHFYGQSNTLGGIVSIKGSDFEKTTGFPNFWSWGYEDNLFQFRAMQSGLTIDRSTFFLIGNQNILQLNENFNRIVNRNEFNRYIRSTNEGFQTISNLVYDIDEDNKYVHVKQFKTEVENNPAGNQLHDLRNGNRPFEINPIQKTGRRNPKMGMVRF